MSNYVTRILSLIVKPKKEPVFSEQATIIQIDDEGAGAFVVIKQHGREDIGKIFIDVEEWPAIRCAINQMIGICKEMGDV